MQFENVADRSKTLHAMHIKNEHEINHNYVRYVSLISLEKYSISQFLLSVDICADRSGYQVSACSLSAPQVNEN